MSSVHIQHYCCNSKLFLLFPHVELCWNYILVIFEGHRDQFVKVWYYTTIIWMDRAGVSSLDMWILSWGFFSRELDLNLRSPRLKFEVTTIICKSYEVGSPSYVCKTLYWEFGCSRECHLVKWSELRSQLCKSDITTRI